jgi:hypothetical protein|nr:MAG TPA: hypothetical protein [Caudoviricetes sp.]
MARYIKANPKVAAYLNLQNDRNTVKDGNYILWQSDLLPFGPLTRLSETLAAIGAIALMPHEAREEQDGVQLRPLPTATDPRFEIPVSVPTETPETPAEPAEGADDTEQPDDNAGEIENPAETDNADGQEAPTSK